MRRALGFAFVLLSAVGAMAGGPIHVGGNGYGMPGKPLTFPPKAVIHYRVDSGAMSLSGTTPVITNAQGLQRVAAMLQVWHDAPHTSLTFQYDGPITGVTGGHVDGATSFVSVLNSCSLGVQSPVVFDASGSLTDALGLDPAVIGFAGACDADTLTGYFKGSFIVMNGAWQDHLLSNGELSANLFDEAITHEFGHFLGLDHSQINVDVFSEAPGQCKSDTLAGLPLMFPFAYCQERKAAGLPVLAPDDIAWISSLYPSDGSSAYGKITGHVFFSDGTSAFQGANVIARRVDDPNTTTNESRSIAVSSVSGYLFTPNPGQTVTAKYLPCKAGATDCSGYLGNNSSGSPFGSRDPALLGYYEVSLPPGDYTIEVESIAYAFQDGSSVGPFTSSQFPVPISEFWNSDESYFDLPTKKTVIHVEAGQTIRDIDIILNGTAPRFDPFEGSDTKLEEQTLPRILGSDAEVLA